jgi:acyl carrier protein
MSDRERRAREAVLAALRKLLESLGVEDYEITDGCRPIGDLGLDSPDGVDFACGLSEELGVDVPKADNPFVDDLENKARTVKQIIDYAGELVRGAEDKKHG